MRIRCSASRGTGSSTRIGCRGSIAPNLRFVKLDSGGDRCCLQSTPRSPRIKEEDNAHLSFLSLQTKKPSRLCACG